MPRLFTGIEIPASQRTGLCLAQNGIPGVRWIDPHDFHITLRFIGDVSTHMANEIFDGLGRKTWTAPHIQFGEIAAFGGAKPTSIHIGVSASEDLKLLQQAHERLMQQFGLRPETRRFTPHVTIGRCRSVKPHEMARYLGAQGGLFLPSFTPTRFVLYSARDSVGGGPYRIEERWPLEKAYGAVSQSLTNI